MKENQNQVSEAMAADLIAHVESVQGAPLGTPVNVSSVATGSVIPPVTSTHTIRDLIMSVLENELFTEDSTDIFIGVITAPLPVGIRSVVKWGLDKVLPEWGLKAIRAALYRSVPLEAVQGPDLPAPTWDDK
jgi:hypothetical protein